MSERDHIEPPSRRRSESIQVGPFIARVGFYDNGYPCEVFIEARGKSGTDLDDLLRKLGIGLSRIMQGDPRGLDDV